MGANGLRTKSIEHLVRDAGRGAPLERTLTAADLALLGIGATIGTGIFILTGRAAADFAGPAIVVSFVIAGLACAFAALSYAELSAVLPISGSAYTYAYASLGELVAWMVAWDLVLEYSVGSMTVAVAWSAYLQQMLGGFGVHLPQWMIAAPNQEAGSLFNGPAVLIVCALSALLVVGVRKASRLNAAMVAIKVLAILLFIGVGAGYIRREHWSPFLPYGWPGVFLGSSVAFFAYVGFDAVTATAQEARAPARDVPKGMLASLIICAILYFGVAAVLSGIVPIVDLRGEPRFLDAPVAFAVRAIDQDWLAALASAGAFVGITTVLLVMLMCQPRIFLAMSRDGLLPSVVGRVHPRFKTPYVVTIVTCTVVAMAAGFLPVQVVGDLTSIGTLFAFVVVSLAVIVLRVRQPDLARPFKAGAGLVVPILGVLSSLALMFTLSVMTWVRFLVWLDLGLLVYWFFIRARSPLASSAELAAPEGLDGVPGFAIVFGAAIALHGIAIATLALLSTAGLTPESLARWGELDDFVRPLGLQMSPRIADGLGATIAIAGLALLGAGLVMSYRARKRLSLS
jgi:basic amino acid/polyamine antiporter, APA family